MLDQNKHGTMATPEEHRAELRKNKRQETKIVPKGDDFTEQFKIPPPAEEFEERKKQHAQKIADKMLAQATEKLKESVTGEVELWSLDPLAYKLRKYVTPIIQKWCGIHGYHTGREGDGNTVEWRSSIPPPPPMPGVKGKKVRTLRIYIRPNEESRKQKSANTKFVKKFILIGILFSIIATSIFHLMY